MKKLFGIYRENAHIVLNIFGLKIRFKSFIVNQLADCCAIADLEYLKKQNTRIVHPIGIVIHKNVSLGKNCTIYQNVTIGCDEKNSQNVPTIGDNVTIYANSVVFGKIKIGNNVKIGAGSVVCHDVEDNTIVAGSPAKVIGRI